MPGISVHVVDVSRGTPARGMAVEVVRIDAAGARARVGGGRVGDAGVVDDAALARGDGVVPGTHEVVLDAGPWFRAQGVAVGTPAFQERIVYRFELVDVAPHLHLPFKLTPWGVSVWRGI
jgi:5-hydroxyisourate hydrolase